MPPAKGTSDEAKPTGGKPERPLPGTPPGPVVRKPRSRLLLKGAIAVAALALLGMLFLRSVRSARSEPYTIPGATLLGWHVTLVEAASSADPMLAVRVPPEMINSLFGQVFARAMESMRAPNLSMIPLVLQGEVERGPGGRITPEAMLAAARAAGLDGNTMRPRCLAHRRIADAGGVAQLYFVLFEDTAFMRFRAQLAAQAGAGFDPAALSPVMFVASTDPAFERWQPLRADPDKDCVAKISAQP